MANAVCQSIPAAGRNTGTATGRNTGTATGRNIGTTSGQHMFFAAGLNTVVATGRNTPAPGLVSDGKSAYEGSSVSLLETFLSSLGLDPPPPINHTPESGQSYKKEANKYSLG